MALVIIIFLTITSILYPEINILQKGKNYILEKSEEKLEEGKDKVTAYIIIETNETINRAKERIFKAID